MAGKMKKIRQDGREYEFTPGKNGSLLVRGTRSEEPVMAPPKKRAKTLGMGSEKKFRLTRVNGKDLYGL